MEKEQTYEQVKEALIASKKEFKASRIDLKAFLKEHSLKKGEDHSENENHGKKFIKLNEAISKAEAKLEKLRIKAKELRPKKERVLKYVYPEDCITIQLRKKYRVKMRAQKKRDEKALKKSEKSAAEKSAAEKPVKTPNGVPSKENKKKKDTVAQDD